MHLDAPFGQKLLPENFGDMSSTLLSEIPTQNSRYIHLQTATSRVGSACPAFYARFFAKFRTTVGENPVYRGAAYHPYQQHRHRRQDALVPQLFGTPEIPTSEVSPAPLGETPLIPDMVNPAEKQKVCDTKSGKPKVTSKTNKTRGLGTSTPDYSSI